MEIFEYLERKAERNASDNNCMKVERRLIIIKNIKI